jgi:hypothetical protein
MLPSLWGGPTGMRRRLLLQLLGGFVIATAGLSAGAVAQVDPRPVLGAVIEQLQTGRLVREWYGDQLWRAIIDQGTDPLLVQGGPVSSIDVMQTALLAQGVYYRLATLQSNGMRLSWEMVIINNRIERLSSAPFPPPSAPFSDQPVPTPEAPSYPRAPTSPGIEFENPPQTDPCKRFPNLC